MQNQGDIDQIRRRKEKMQPSMQGDMIYWGLFVAALPLLFKAFWYFNDAYYGIYSKKFGGKLKLPPGHMGLPLIGETFKFLWYFKFLARPDDFIKSKNEKYGDEFGIYKSHIFGHPTIITCSPASNNFVFRSADFHGRWPSLELIGTNNISSVEGKQHEVLRNFIVKAINLPNALRKISQLVQPRIISTLESWAEKGTINGLVETKKVVFHNICHLFVSMDPGHLLDEMEICFTSLVAGMRAYPLRFPGSAFHNALMGRKRLVEIFRHELEKRKKIIDETDEESDMMDGLMRVKDENGRKLSDDEVIDNILAFVVAGYESTSLASMWALYYLSKSPDALQKLREENERICNDKSGKFISMDDISKLKHTSKVVEETIRMANIAPTAFRVATRDTEYKGYIIPKGWQVVVWLRSLHTDPNNFDDPLCFKPERWENVKPGCFQPFGGGPRICAGNMLVRVQLTVMLHHLALNYRWKLINPDAKIKYLPHPKPEDGAIMSFTKL